MLRSAMRTFGYRGPKVLNSLIRSSSSSRRIERLSGG
jgi:hypothetical protein